MERRDQLGAAVVEHAAAQPRNRVQRSAAALRAANVPSATITFGWMMSICWNRNGSQVSTSSGSGLRFCGGRHLMTFAMYTSLARQADRFDDLRQQLAGAADERHRPGRLRRRRAPRRRTSDRPAGCRRRRRPAVRPSVCSLQRVQSPMSARSAAQRVGGTRERHDGRLGIDAAARRSAAASTRCRHARIAADAGDAELGAKRRCSLTSDRRSTRCVQVVPQSTLSSRSGRVAVSGFSRTRLDRRLRAAARRDRGSRPRRAPSTAAAASRRPSAADDRHRVGVDVEAGVGARHVVGDDQVDVLRARSLAAARAHDVLGLGGEADEQRTRRRSPAGARRGRPRMSGVFFEHQRQRVVALRDLLRRPRRPACSRRRPRP